MKIIRYNESEYIKWTTFNNYKAREFLEDVFIDFLEPTDNSKKASVDIEKIGYHTLACWSINIPIESCKIDKLSSIIDDLHGKIKYVEDSIPKTKHWVSMGKDKIEISFFSDQD